MENDECKSFLKVGPWGSLRCSQDFIINPSSARGKYEFLSLLKRKEFQVLEKRERNEEELEIVGY